MIKYEWRTELDDTEATELADLLARAAAYDAEPEYSTIDFSDVEAALAQRDSRQHHLIIWMLPYATAMDEPDRPERVAGLLRLTVEADGSAEAALVIDPSLRSIGITTLLLERVGLDTAGPDGWMGTGAHVISAWARGNHPAAGRLGNRFLIPRTRRVWKLIRPTDSLEKTSSATVLETLDDGRLGLREHGSTVGTLSLDLEPVASDEFGPCATIEQCASVPHAGARTRRQLLDGATAAAHDAGLSGVIIYVDSADPDVVNACRLAGFQHDRTDVRFELGTRR